VVTFCYHEIEPGRATVGITLEVERPDGTLAELYEHEGALEFWDSGKQEWSSGWGHEHLGSPGHDPVKVRARCECGWRGVELPWTAQADYPTEEQHDALMAVWYHEHANPIRRDIERASAGR
jgi:hypothetical protein